MASVEGLILQGCGGDLQEWVDGINDLLTEDGILLAGSRFREEGVTAFEYAGLTDLLFPFQGVKLDMGRLAIWRLQSYLPFEVQQMIADGMNVPLENEATGWNGECRQGGM